MITVTAPTTIPESVQIPVIFLQYKVSRIAGTDEAPNHAHANPTRSRIVSFFVHAKIKAAIATTKIETLPNNTYLFSDASVLTTALYKSSTRAEEVTMSCEEMVLIIAARTAASTIPAMNGWNTT